MENKKIKVAIVINDFLVGGAQKQLTILLPQLDREKFDLSLITLFEFDGKETIYKELPEWLPVYRLNFTGFHDISSWLKLFRLLRKISPDLVISSLFFSNTLIRIMKPLLGYRVISREHNTYIDKTNVQIFLDKILSHLSYKIVAVSREVSEFAAKQAKISPSKFVIIHNGIDLEKIETETSRLPEKSQLRKKLGLNESDKIFINVSRLIPQKNHNLLINSFAKFTEVYPEYKLIIVGEGALREELERVIRKLGLSEKVFLAGHKANVVEYLRASDFFVSTSLIEGLSNAYLEALACDLPIVSTRTGGTDELIVDGRNGCYIDKLDVGSVVKAMERLINLKLDNPSEFIKGFDIHTTALKYEELFLNCHAS